MYLIVLISSSFDCFLFAACICAYTYLNTWPGTSVVLFVLIKILLSIQARQISEKKKSNKNTVCFATFPVESSIADTVGTCQNFCVVTQICFSEFKINIYHCQ